MGVMVGDSNASTFDCGRVVSAASPQDIGFSSWKWSPLRYTPFFRIAQFMQQTNNLFRLIQYISALVLLLKPINSINVWSFLFAQSLGSFYWIRELTRPRSTSFQKIFIACPSLFSICILWLTDKSIDYLIKLDTIQIIDFF